MRPQGPPTPEPMRIRGSGPRRNPKTPSEFRLQYADAGQGRASARHSDCAVVPRRRRAAGQEHRHCSLKSPEHLTEDHRAGEQSALRHQITSALNSRVANALAACSAYGTPDRKPHSKSAPDLSLPTAGCIWRRRRSGSKSARSTQRETTGQLFNLHRNSADRLRYLSTGPRRSRHRAHATLHIRTPLVACIRSRQRTRTILWYTGIRVRPHPGYGGVTHDLSPLDL